MRSGASAAIWGRLGLAQVHPEGLFGNFGPKPGHFWALSGGRASRSTRVYLTPWGALGWSPERASRAGGPRRVPRCAFGAPQGARGFPEVPVRGVSGRHLGATWGAQAARGDGPARLHWCQVSPNVHRRQEIESPYLWVPQGASRCLRVPRGASGCLQGAIRVPSGRLQGALGALRRRHVAGS